MLAWMHRVAKISGISQISGISVLLAYMEFWEHGLDGLRRFSRIASSGIRAEHASMAAPGCQDHWYQSDQRHQCPIVVYGVREHRWD